MAKTPDPKLDHPQNLRPFKKGQSGNPGGMTKEERELRKLIKEQAIPGMVKRIDDIAKRIEDPNTPPMIRFRLAKYILEIGIGKPRAPRPEQVARFRPNLSMLTTAELGRLRHYVGKMAGKIPIDTPLPRRA